MKKKKYAIIAFAFWNMCDCLFWNDSTFCSGADRKGK